MIQSLQRAAGAFAGVWRELGYAQRRMFELRTQLPDLAGSGGTERSRASVGALESLWSLPAREPDRTSG